MSFKIDTVESVFHRWPANNYLQKINKIFLLKQHQSSYDRTKNNRHCHTMWLFYLHSIVEIQTVIHFSVGVLMAEVWHRLFFWNFKKGCAIGKG